MLRRNVRLRKEYLYKKALEEKDNLILDRKKTIKEALANGKPISPNDRALELQLRGKLELEDERSLQQTTTQDDEYAYANVKDPRILLTTCRDPSLRLLQFVKELKLIFPNSDRVNRGSYVMNDLVKLCQANSISDLILVHEHRGIPDGLVISHMPLGPTVYFSLEDVVLRHDLPNKPPPVSVVAPHLIFDNLTSRLGQRMTSVLKYLFPTPSPLNKRVLSFVNRNDKIHFRHFVWNDERHAAIKDNVYKNIPENDSSLPPNETTAISLQDEKDARRATVVAKRNAKSIDNINLSEIGPRFVLKPYRIELGTVDQKDLEVEWSLKPYFNKPKQALAT